MGFAALRRQNGELGSPFDTMRKMPMDQVLNSIPVQEARIAIEIMDGEVLLYHPQRTAAIYLNQSAGLVWGLCDGNRSVAEIIRLLAEHYPDALGNLEMDVCETIESLRRQGALM
jgi:coenzyme PQQ biosynthesis protein PqqD